VPSNPICPVVYRLSSGTAAFPRSALTTGAPKTSAVFNSSSVAPSAPRPARIATLVPAFKTSAARRRSLSSGSRALRAKTSDVWPGAFRFEPHRIVRVLRHPTTTTEKHKSNGRTAADATQDYGELVVAGQVTALAATVGGPDRHACVVSD
jgi:hypothetical protein